VTLPESRRRAYGLDFSGGVDAGRKIWVAGGMLDGDDLQVEICCPAESLPNSARRRAAALSALREFIAARRDAVFGCDFPFGLPGELVEQPTWEAFVEAFAVWPDAEAFRDGCRSATGGREPKRCTDREARTPFASFNARLYRQTYHGIRDVLAPLMRDGVISVPPMQAAHPDRAWLLEICPASTLKRMGLYLPYKGRTAEHRAARARILDAVIVDGRLTIPSHFRDLALGDPDGDALDAIIAAATAARTVRRPLQPAADAWPNYRIEGYVYV
jgi:hypothetical protein